MPPGKKSSEPYDAVLVVSFGGPDGPDDVIPFLENVLRGRNVPHERMLAVAEHYYQFGGVSPINAQNQTLIAALIHELNAYGPKLPVYWGNRNWHPLLPNTLQKMSNDGIRRALAFFTSPYNSYSSCRQYREDIERARAEVGESAPIVEKLRAYFNHPGFIESMADRVRTAFSSIDDDRRGAATVLFTAHSIPIAMAETCQYAAQIAESSRLVAEACGCGNWQLVFQSRSGPLNQPWLEPDVCDVLEEIGRRKSKRDVVIVPIGFISDHMEVVYDLDVEADDVCRRYNLNMIRTGTVGAHPRFVTMIRELIADRVDPSNSRIAIGQMEPSHDVCPIDCCEYTPKRPPASSQDID